MINPTLTRRAVLKGAAVGGTVVVIGGAATLESCNASAWVQTALNDLPAIISAVEAILQIVAAAQGVADPAAVAKAQQLGAQAKTDLTLVQTLITGYNSAPTDTTLQKIDAGLLDAQSNLAGIEAALHISDPAKQAAIAAGVSGAIVFVVSLQLVIPPPATPVPSPSPVTAAHAAKRRAIHSAAKSNDQSLAIRVAFNEIMAAAGATQYNI